VGAIYPKGMPVIPQTPEHYDVWMSAPWTEAEKLLRPLPDGSLRIVGQGARQRLEATMMLCANASLVKPHRTALQTRLGEPTTQAFVIVDCATARQDGDYCGLHPDQPPYRHLQN
jgi:hypothetical protein